MPLFTVASNSKNSCLYLYSDVDGPIHTCSGMSSTQLLWSSILCGCHGLKLSLYNFLVPIQAGPAKNYKKWTLADLCLEEERCFSPVEFETMLSCLTLYHT